MNNGMTNEELRETADKALTGLLRNSVARICYRRYQQAREERDTLAAEFWFPHALRGMSVHDRKALWLR